MITAGDIDLSAAAYTAETTALAVTALAAGDWVFGHISAIPSTPPEDCVIEILE
jgi:hypothetical protein